MSLYRGRAVVESERNFQIKVIEAAELLGWLVYHTHDSRRSQPGYPDLTMVRERVVFAELKAKTGQVRPDQIVWAQRLTNAGQEVYLWRPADWPEVLEVLRKPSK